MFTFVILQNEIYGIQPKSGYRFPFLFLSFPLHFICSLHMKFPYPYSLTISYSCGKCCCKLFSIERIFFSTFSPFHSIFFLAFFGFEQSVFRNSLEKFYFSASLYLCCVVASMRCIKVLRITKYGTRNSNYVT